MNLEAVALKLAEAHDNHLAGKSGCAVAAYKAGSPAVAYWNNQAQAAINAADIGGLVEALQDIANGNRAIEDGSDYSRGWNAARFRMSEIARAALERQQ